MPGLISVTVHLLCAIRASVLMLFGVNTRSMICFFLILLRWKGKMWVKPDLISPSALWTTERLNQWFVLQICLTDSLTSYLTGLFYKNDADRSKHYSGRR